MVDRLAQISAAAWEGAKVSSSVEWLAMKKVC